MQRLVSRQIPPLQQGLNRVDIENMLRNHFRDIRELAMGEKGVVVNIKDISSAYTPTETDDVLFCWGDTTISLSAADTLKRKTYWIKDISTSQITVDSSTQIDDATRQNLAAAESMCVFSDGAEWRIVTDK